jgi:phage shock protein A
VVSFTATKHSSWDNASLESITSFSIRSFEKIDNKILQMIANACTAAEDAHCWSSHVLCLLPVLLSLEYRSHVYVIGI